jgi:N-acetylglucosaminyl-diphospho-decaprenol L-rhamnosyltransferase
MASARPDGKGATIRLAVVVLNYNSYQDSRECVEGLLELGIASREQVVLVDNCSPDGSGERLRRDLPGVNVVLSPRNGGFGSGLNIGFGHAADCDCYLVLNPDTRFAENRLAAALEEFKRDPRLGVLGLNLVNPDGSPQLSARRFYSLLTIALRRTPLGRWTLFQRLHREHLMAGAWAGGVFEADWVMGAGFIVRRSALRDVGGMDEGYFLYLEDTDLCRRMWGAGWKVKAIPQVKLVHHHARASKGALSPAGKHHLRSLWRYSGKFGLPLLGHGRRP